ncbi:MAG: YbhB/YbcL family Raf kinase inhibitor-like protein [Acidimicrobiaceae bacterium]|nr:YbhB/YbcL family Raf kinase inhibitor-like protein [Acidimicrobiaceae bacterium]
MSQQHFRNRKIIAVFCGLIALSTGTIACSRDGRVLREAGPGQGESIAIVTTTIEVAETEQVAQTPIFSVSGTWIDGGAIDPRHTCFGANISPALKISNMPSNAASLAITLVDLADPEKPLWVVANIAPTETIIQEGGVPAGAIVGASSIGAKIVKGYSGPCPIGNELGEYSLVVYALDQMLEFVPGPKSLDDSRLLLDAIRGGAFKSTETRFFSQTT